MPFDVEVIVIKIYSHFYLFTVRVAKLEDFCDSVHVEYKNCWVTANLVSYACCHQTNQFCEFLVASKNIFWETIIPQIL